MNFSHFNHGGMIYDFIIEPECKKMNSSSGYQSPDTNMPAMQAVQQVREKSTFHFANHFE